MHHISQPEYNRDIAQSCSNSIGRCPTMKCHPQCFPTAIGGFGWTLIKFEELLFFTNSIPIHICIFRPKPVKPCDISNAFHRYFIKYFHISILYVIFPTHFTYCVCNITSSAAYQHSPHLIFSRRFGHISRWNF